MTCNFPTWGKNLTRVASVQTWGNNLTCVASVQTWGNNLTRVASVQTWGNNLTCVASVQTWGNNLTHVASVQTWGNNLTWVASVGWLYFLLDIRALEGLPQTTLPKVKSLTESSVWLDEPTLKKVRSNKSTIGLHN